MSFGLIASSAVSEAMPDRSGNRTRHTPFLAPKAAVTRS